MKTISELYQEAKSNEELRNNFLAAYGKGEIEGFLKDNECDATLEEVQKFLKQEIRSGSCELSEEDLALVVGGFSKDSDDPPKFKENDYVRYTRNCHTSEAEHKGHVIKVRGTNGFGEYQYDIRRDLDGGYWDNIIDDADESEMFLISG